MKRLLIIAAVTLFAGSTAAQTIQQSSADGNRFGAVVNIPSTGKSYPSDSKSEARAVVLVSPTGVPYSAASGSTGNTTLNGQNGTSTASTTNPLPANTAQVAGTATSVNTGATDAGTQRVVLGATEPSLSIANFPASQAVTNTGTFAVQNTAATPTGTNNIGSVTGNLGYVESTTPQAANGAYVGATRTAPAWASYFGCRATSDQASSASGLNIQESLDGGVTFYTKAGPQTVPATGTGDLTLRVRGPGLYRCTYTNGATAATITQIASSFTAN